MKRIAFPWMIHSGFIDTPALTYRCGGQHRNCVQRTRTCFPFNLTEGIGSGTCKPASI